MNIFCTSRKLLEHVVCCNMRGSAVRVEGRGRGAGSRGGVEGRGRGAGSRGGVEGRGRENNTEQVNQMIDKDTTY